MSYSRESRRLTQLDVDRMVALAASENCERGVIEVGDAKTVGLTLRIIPGKAVWYVRRREITLRLAEAQCVTLEDARYYAEQIRLAAGRSVDLKKFAKVLVDYAPGRNPPSSADMQRIVDHGIAHREKAMRVPEPPIWTWATLTERFLQHKLPKLKEKYRKQYEHYLRLPEFGPLRGKLVAEIKLRDLEKVRDAIFMAHAPSAVHRALTQSKKMLSWAWRFEATKAGLDQVDHEWWLRWSFEYKTQVRTHEPTIQEIARVLAIAETFRHLAEGEHDTYPGTLGALWGVALTAQRTGAFLLLQQNRLFDAAKVDRKLRGWQIANWTAQEMKGGRDGGRPHSLPLPPNTLRILRKFHKEAEGNSAWMFPARTPDKHVTPSALTLLMYRLQGRVYDHTVKQKPSRKGKPGPKPRPKKQRRNLFKEFDIRPFTLHDCRRALATFLDERRLGGAATAILGHKSSTSRMDEREKLAPVTEQHYSRSQKIDLKAEGMLLWTKALLAAYEHERTKIRRSALVRLAA
jgi:integrase